MGQRLWVLTERGDWIRADQIVRVTIQHFPSYTNSDPYKVVAVLREFSGSWSDGDGGVSADAQTLVKVSSEEAATEAASVVVRGLADCAEMAALLDFTQGRVELTPVSNRA